MDADTWGMIVRDNKLPQTEESISRDKAETAETANRATAETAAETTP
jgi:hypothetical protein